MTPELDDDDAPKKPTRAKIIRTIVAVIVALACGVVFAYLRWGMKKAGLGEPCAYKLNCGPEAPTCLKQTEDADGVCSRSCEPGPDASCAPGIACVKVELDERDDRGVPLEGGYCVPQRVLDARRAARAPREPAAPKDSVLEVPEIAGQLEGEIDVKWERPGAPSTAHYLVKGTLVRDPAAGAKRHIGDASSMRVFAVDDDKKTFAASALEGAGPSDGVRVVKTEAKAEVAGVSCDVWRVEEPKANRETCVVIGGAFVDPTGRSAPAWLRELAVRSAFPLRMIERDAQGTEKSRMTVTRLERHPVGRELFVVPRAYKNLAGK